MKKRTLALMLSAALCVGLLAGCGSGNNDPVNTPAAGGSETPSQESTAALSGTVNTNGSTSMESVMGYLTEGFKEVQPGITVNYTGSGSSAGVTGAQDGTCDIGPSRIDGLFGRDHSVIGRTGAADEQHHKYDHYDPDNFFHFFYRFLVNFQIYQREPAPPPPKLPPPKPPPKPPPEPCPPPKPPIHIPPPPRWLLLSLRALRDCRFTTKPHLPQR